MITDTLIFVSNSMYVGEKYTLFIESGQRYIKSNNGLSQTAGSAVLLGKGISTISTTAGMISNFENASRIFAGKFYLNENVSFGEQLLQGVSRYTWEGLQTWAGYNYSQIRNTVGNVSRVDYLDGATFATRENAGLWQGISIGNFINVAINDNINGSFRDHVLSDPLFMHEYGHTFDSRKWGVSYVFAVGLPSLISAGFSRQVPGEPDVVTTHGFRSYEMRANRNAARYFGVNWSIYETRYPRRRR